MAHLRADNFTKNNGNERTEEWQLGPDSVEKVALMTPLSTDSVFLLFWETECDDGTEAGGARRAVL